MQTLHLILPAALTLTSCTLGPDFRAPDLAAGSKWKETQANSAIRLPDNWWRLFNDRELTSLRCWS